MTITKVLIRNYRTLRNTTVSFGPGTTVVVGSNDAGKSTLLEAIQLALTGQLAGKPIRYQLHPYLFNREASIEFARKAGSSAPPEILIEVHMEECRDFAALAGNNTHDGRNSTGVSLRIRLKEEYQQEFKDYVAAGASSGRDDVDLLAVEYFDVEWKSFADQALSARTMPLKSQLIDPASLDPRRGTGRYITHFVRDLPQDERVRLAVAYRALKQQFQANPGVRSLNAELQERAREVSDRRLSVAMDMTASNDWDQGVSPMLDDIPFDLVGKGEQAAVRMLLALNAKKERAHLFMIEEPENHLSFVRLNKLLAVIERQVQGRQLIVTTHSSFVLNKLGLDDLLLFNRTGGTRLTELATDTTNYFKRLPGYDTLRMVLAKRVILVEGPSDELVVQRAYMDTHGGRQPVQDEVDVLSVGSLAFPRYLDLAARLSCRVAVVTDNDGDPNRVKERLGRFDAPPRMQICYSEDRTLPTLEPQLVACNDLYMLNSVLGKSFSTKEAAAQWMVRSDNKTEAALRIFQSPTTLNYPEYILRAVRA